MLFFGTLPAVAQIDSIQKKTGCTYRLTGCILDSADQKPVQYADVRIKGSQIGAVTDIDGDFSIKGLCNEQITLLVTSLGYAPTEIVLDLNNYTSKFIHIHRTMQNLGMVSITGAAQKQESYTQTQSVSSISLVDIDRTRGMNLGEALKTIPGLNSIQSGPSISKPVIHGLHSNRILILNNGVRQEGQQWGGEHGPELDPFTASKFTVVMGAASIRYGSDAIGGVILLEPKEWRSTPGIGGELNLVAASNGLMGGISGMLEGSFGKKLGGLNWRVQGTLKKAGNTRTANYYLKNTGMQEGDFSASLGYTRKNYGFEAYYSQYNTSIGIFTGSHVGNLQDLMLAFNNKEPLEPSGFNYNISRPRQAVNHNLLKASAFVKFPKAGKLEAVYAYQTDRRREFQSDAIFSSNPEVKKLPQIDFSIGTHTADVIFSHKPKSGFSGSIGINGITQSNVYRGLIPLIPNYRNYGIGIFAFEQWTHRTITLEAGVRYDYRWMQAYKLSSNGTGIHKPTFTYQNITTTFGIKYAPNKHWSFLFNYGSAWRPPSVNELFINGVHQSAAAYELGDSTLKTERAYNFSTSTKYVSHKLDVELGAYFNLINGYIYSRPTLKTVSLISGTYPLFQYTQADVYFTGIDANITYRIVKGLSIISKTSLIWSYNRSAREYLILTPTHRFDNTVRYEWAKAGPLKNLYISVTNIAVPRQKRVPENSDYVAPPSGYVLFHFNAGFAVPLGKKEIGINAGLYNFTNQSYRDYLNRFRYFADEPGINFMLQAKFTF